MALTLVLAKNITEANRYARAVGLPRFSYRAVRNAAAIRGVRHAEVHLLSTFLDRLDRHAIMAALRSARYLEVFYVDWRDGEIVGGTEPSGTQIVITAVADDVPAPESHTALVARVLAQPEDDSDDLLFDIERFENEGARLSALVPETENEEDRGQTGETEPSEDAAPAAEPPKRRRRTRCPKCEQLHFKDDSCPVEETKQPDPADFFN